MSENEKIRNVLLAYFEGNVELLQAFKENLTNDEMSIIIARITSSLLSLERYLKFKKGDLKMNSSKVKVSINSNNRRNTRKKRPVGKSVQIISCNTNSVKEWKDLSEYIQSATSEVRERIKRI